MAARSFPFLRSGLRLGLGLGLPLLAACATHDDISAYPDLAAAMQDLQHEQKRFAATTVLPRTFEFPGQGTVTVRQLSLDGYPGNTYLKCRWHYVNTTGKPVLRALVSLDVLDPEGRMVASKVAVCIFPAISPIHEGAWYSDELRTLTHDVHELPGWSWRVTCKAEFYDDEPTVGGEVK